MKYRVKTEACDVYYYDSKKKLSREEIAKKVWEDEGKCEELLFYIDTISLEEVPETKRKKK